MPNFQYVAQDENGKRVRGTMNVADELELHAKLQEQRMFLISSTVAEYEYRGRPLKARSLADFNRQIGELVSSGVSLVRALSIITEAESLKQYEYDAYYELSRRVRQGIPMSQAMEEMGNVFPPLLINMYKSAEASGNLDKVALRMANHYDKEWRLAGKIRSATLYPKILAVLVVAVVVVIMAYVLPQFADLFAQMPELPAPTVVLMAISDFVALWWWALIAGALLLFVAAKMLLQIPKVRLKFDKFKLRIPVFGKLLKVICTARFARTLSSLYSSGMPLVSGLEIARHTAGNAYVDSQFDAVIAAVRSGENLSDALSTVDGFIKKLEFSIRVGEETGSLDAMLESTADSLEYESEMALTRMVGYLEPALIIFMALIVGFVMVAVIVPIYGSYETIGQNA